MCIFGSCTRIERVYTESLTVDALYMCTASVQHTRWSTVEMKCSVLLLSFFFVFYRRIAWSNVLEWSSSTHSAVQAVQQFRHTTKILNTLSFQMWKFRPILFPFVPHFDCGKKEGKKQQKFCLNKFKFIYFIFESLAKKFQNITE